MSNVPRDLLGLTACVSAWHTVRDHILQVCCLPIPVSSLS